MKQNLSTYLITYDITDSKARSRVLKALRKLSLGYQRSVFECMLNRKQLKALIDYLDDYQKYQHHPKEEGADWSKYYEVI
jgi:CRISPR-associated endonuclease Cas2